MAFQMTDSQRGNPSLLYGGFSFVILNLQIKRHGDVPRRRALHELLRTLQTPLFEEWLVHCHCQCLVAGQNGNYIQPPLQNFEAVSTNFPPKIIIHFEKAVMMMMWFYVTHSPFFTGLGRCPIVSWDFAGAVSIFAPDALPVAHQWLLPGLEPATSRVRVAAHNH